MQPLRINRLSGRGAVQPLSVRHRVECRTGIVKQLTGRRKLCNASCVQHQHARRVDHRVQAVGDGNDGRTGELVSQRRLDDAFCTKRG